MTVDKMDNYPSSYAANLLSEIRNELGESAARLCRIECALDELEQDLEARAELDRKIEETYLNELRGSSEQKHPTRKEINNLLSRLFRL